jgi:HAD superfamily hydrolase (TIGR01458 family)
MENMEKIKGLLIDLDGVIYNDSELITGATESIQWLREKNIPFRFLTNTTMKSRTSLHQKLQSFGIDVKKEEIFTTVYAAVLYIKKSGKNKCHLLLMEDAKEEFSDFNLNAEKPDFVVVGDLGDDLSFERVNIAFQKLLSGAELIALQKNRYWLSDKGYTLDAGAWVAMLEFAANKKGQIMGKPSPHFYALALDDLHLPPENVVMIGDDIESDIIGSHRMGMRGVLVKTGKFLPADLERVDISPWKTIDSIGDLQYIFTS